MKKHNFSAGPAILPQSVFEEASQAVLDFKGTGLSLLEMSHRGPEIVSVLEEAHSLVHELLDLNDNQKVLFLTGGASTQFFMAPLNLYKPSDKVTYVNTGTWSTKAIKEAGRYCQLSEVSSKDKAFTYIPKENGTDANTAYLHITSNNTIRGTQYHEWPKQDTRLICDMSSDIFSRSIPADRFDLIYAGAQKNMGPAGTTLVIVNEDVLGNNGRDIPTMLDYRTHIGKLSSFNTPPVFPIYISMLTMRWVKANGGVDAMAKRNEAKAKILYNAIDQSPLFNGSVEKGDRSLMNVPFVPVREELTAPFLAMATEAGCSGLKGHRSVGGCRASIYNAMPIESVQVLADVIDAFDKKHG